MQNLVQHVRYALRQLRLSPIFTLTAMFTLALGIGATTAIFSLVHSVMLRSLPVADPASLYQIGDKSTCCVWGGTQDDWSLFSYALFQRLKAATPEFEELAAFQAGRLPMTVRRAETTGLAKSLNGEFISGNYFSMFGVGSFAGRVLTPSDDQPAAAPAAVMSYRAWQQEYGADPSVVGSTMMVEGHAFTIVGIAPPGFFGDTLQSDPPEIWLPLQQEPMLRGTSSLLNHTSTNWLRAIGRLRPGASVAGMDARLTAVLQHWIPESGLPPEWLPRLTAQLNKQYLRVVPAGRGVNEMRTDYGSSLRILLTICSLVLLIACANIANLLLARGTVRKQQTSVQLALGASRSHLVQQALTESLVLAVLGGVAGIGVAYLGTRLILVLAFHSAHFIPISASPSLPVLAFALGLSLLTGVLFGTAPAWLATHADPAEALRGANRSTRDRSSFPQRTLVVVQAAISVVLLASAGMLTRSFTNLEHQDFGFATANRVSVLMNQPAPSMTPQQLQTLDHALVDRLDRLPGVERSAVALYTPFTDNWTDRVFVEGQATLQDDTRAGAPWDRVSAGYFETMGQPILRGRGIEEQDTPTSRPVAVVTETFARKYFGNQDPLGKHFGIDMQEYAGTFEVVGVVHDSKYSEPKEPFAPMFFLPLTQTIAYKPPVMMMGETRSHFITGAVLLFHGDIGRLEPQIRQAFAEVDPNLTVTKIQTMQEQVAADFDQQRAVAQLAGLFGIVALLLAAVGLYGVTAYTVARRTGEIGLRMALGADRVHVVRLVLRGAFLQIAIGLLIGIPVAIAGGRMMRSKMYDVASWDPEALGVAVLLLAFAAVIASLIPAGRASSIDPVKALRTE